MNKAGQKEFALLAACCIWPPSEKRIHAIRAAAKPEIDWDRLLRAARRQRVDALLLDGLRAAAIAMPAPVQEALETRAMRTAQQNTALAGESVRLQKQFDEAGIPNLVLKGATLSVLAYDNPFVKAAWDIDLLVGPGEAERGIAVLEAAGYVRTDPVGLTPAQFKTYLAMARECIFVKGRLFVEIKWRLSDNPELLRDVSIFSSSQLVKLSATLSLRTLGRDDLFAYMCVHGAMHCWARLKWIADLAALLSRESLKERERLYRQAERRGAGPSAAQALLLCHRLLDTELPSPLVAELERDWRVRWLVAAAMFVMTGGRNEEEIHRRRFVRTATALSHFLMGKGRRFLGREIRNQWVSVHDHVHLALPGWARFLYPVIRLPLFLWRRI